MATKAIQTECSDKHCPTHGHFSTHGARIEGIVKTDKMKRSAVVERPFFLYSAKYEGYEKRTTRVTAHNPDCIRAKAGDKVIVKECRPISKLKSFVIVEKVVK